MRKLLQRQIRGNDPHAAVGAQRNSEPERQRKQAYRAGGLLAPELQEAQDAETGKIRRQLRIFQHDQLGLTNSFTAARADACKYEFLIFARYN